LPFFPQAAAVERFVIVHGQIILNQFKHFPSKAVRASAFPASLRAAMEMRRHSKLYIVPAKPVRAKGVNRNPMRVRPPAPVWMGLLVWLAGWPAASFATFALGTPSRRVPSASSRALQLLRRLFVGVLCPSRTGLQSGRSP
jgi:hypothetical protein